MRCLKCGRETGNVEKCVYCGGPVEKSTDSRFSTTIIESADFLNKLADGDQSHKEAPYGSVRQPSQPQFQGQNRPPLPQAPGIPPQQSSSMPPQQYRQAHPPQAAYPGAGRNPLQPAQPVKTPQQMPQQQTPGFPQRPSAMPPQPPKPPVQQGFPVQTQPRPAQPAGAVPAAMPIRPQPVQARPVQQPSGFATPPQQGYPPVQPRPAAPVPAQPLRPPMPPQQNQGQVQYPAQPIPPSPARINPIQPLQQPRQPITLQPQKPAVPVPPSIRPVQAGIPNYGQIPQSQAGTDLQMRNNDGITEPIEEPLNPGPQPLRPVQPSQFGADHTKTPAAPPVQPDWNADMQQADFIPPSPAVGHDIPSYESGIDIKPVDDSMEVISSGDFIAAQGDNQFGFQSFDGGGSNESLPPAFARAQEEASNIPSLPRTLGDNRLQAGAAGSWSSEEFPFEREETRKGPYISKQQSHTGNEATYKIITIAMTIIAFFSLRIIDTLRVGISNPYDKIYFIKLIIFGLMFSFTGYLFFIKQLGKKESLVKTAIIILLIIGVLGSFLGISGITTSADSNFYSVDAPIYYRLLDSPKGMAKNPVFSPNGDMAVINYAPNNMVENTIHILKINLANEEKPADKVELPVACNKQMYWRSNSEIIFPGRKINPTEPFKFEMIEANTGIVGTIFMSYDYNFTMDFDYSRNTNKIVASFANILWTLDLESGEIMPITGLDILARQIDQAPVPSDISINPKDFMVSLAALRGSVSSFPYLDISPRFSPDGKEVFFIRTNPNNPQDSRICRVRLDNINGAVKPTGLKTSADLMEYLQNTVEILSPDATAYGNIAVSPSSRFLACWVRAKNGDSQNISMNENALVIFDINEKALIRIFPTYQTEARIDSMDWSKDSKYLIADMASGVNSIIIMIELPSAIYDMDIKGKPEENL